MRVSEWRPVSRAFRCCQECDHRFLACWGSCEEYKKAKADYEAIREKQRIEKLVTVRHNKIKGAKK